MRLLVVVDMQVDFVTGVLGTKEAQEIVQSIAGYIRKFKAAGGTVVFTKDTHTKEYLNTQEGRKLPVEHCIIGTDGWQFVPEVRELAKGTAVFEKSTFGSISLAEYIREKGFDEVQFCGVCTGICDISNAVLAKTFAPEAEIVILRDLCACVTPTTNGTALDAMATLQMTVADSANIVL